MATKTIPSEIKQQADAIVANFNKTVIQDPGKLLRDPLPGAALVS